MIAARFVRTGRRAFTVCAAVIGFGALAVPGQAAAQSTEVYGSEALTTPPKLMSMSKTASLMSQSYPSRLKSAGIGGTVQVQFIVGVDGKVEPGSIEVVASTVAALAEAAKQVAEKMEFSPGKVNDAPVRARVVLPLVYQAK